MTRDRTASAWIAYHRENRQARLRLFCFPYAGGSALVFRNWADHLPTDIEVCPIQFPGRENRLRESSFTRLTPLVETLTEEISYFFDRPFVLLGHSLGALVGFEVTRQLRRQLLPSPLHLFVSACRAPQITGRGPRRSDLPRAELMAELRQLNGTPPQVLENDEFMELMLPMMRADFAIYDTYDHTPETPLDCPITAFGGLTDTEVSREQLEAWREQTTCAFDLRLFPGDHFYLHTDLPLLLGSLSQDLGGIVRALNAPQTP